DGHADLDEHFLADDVPGQIVERPAGEHRAVVPPLDGDAVVEVVVRDGEVPAAGQGVGEALAGGPAQVEVVAQDGGPPADRAVLAHGDLQAERVRVVGVVQERPAADVGGERGAGDLLPG